MANEIQGELTGNDIKVGIVVSRFNEFITRRLLDGALDCLSRHGIKAQDVDVVWVPGAFEIPMTARQMVSRRQYQAILCLGAVIRGATPHFDYVAGEAARGIGTLAMEASLPVLFGVLTTDTIEQAIERAGTKGGNKGWETALAAIEMANLFKKL